MPRIASLTVYPLKSAAGIPVETLTLDARGATGDRRWLLIDGDGTAITARECHRLLHVVPRFATTDRNGALMLNAPRLPTFTATVPDADAPAVTAIVWGDAVKAFDAGDDAAAWCSDAIGRACRLVHLADESERPLKPKYAGPLPHEARTVAFSDGAPLMLLSLASIDALNARLMEQGHGEPLDRRRFRANVWLAECTPHEEDTWSRVQVGTVELGLGSLCSRCVLTTVDPDTLERGPEPLRAFAQYRRADDGVVFGVNATHAAPGAMHVGETLQVLARRD